MVASTVDVDPRFAGAQGCAEEGPRVVIRRI